jgi:hypothetical protein
MFVPCPPVFRRSVVVGIKSKDNGVDRRQQDRTENTISAAWRRLRSGRGEIVEAPDVFNEITAGYVCVAARWIALARPQKCIHGAIYRAATHEIREHMFAPPSSVGHILR